MSHWSPRRCVLLVLVLLGGCRKSAPEVVDAGPPAVVAFAVPSARSTLSVFEPSGTNCEWRQVEPVAGTKVVLATFPGACVGARVAWSPDTSKAVVWFDPMHVQHAGYSTQVSSKSGYADEVPEEKSALRAYVVSTRKAQVEPLPISALPGHALQELGVDGTGAVISLFEEAVPDDAKGLITSGAQKFELSTITEGLPVLVHAFRREGAEWKKFETKLSSTGWDYGLGVKELEAQHRLGPSSEDLSRSMAQGDSVEGEPLAALGKLAPKGAGADDGAWIFVGAGGARLYVWEISGEFAHTTGLVALGSPPVVLPKLGFNDGDLVAIRTSGPFVLIAGSDVGTHPRLYQLPAGKLVFSSDTARAATFWPSTAKPESHE